MGKPLASTTCPLMVAFWALWPAHNNAVDKANKQKRKKRMKWSLIWGGKIAKKQKPHGKRCAGGHYWLGTRLFF
jgi:hypothetical protein